MKQENESIKMKMVDNSYFLKNLASNTFILKTKGNFLWRIWFLISAPFIWIVKGEINIK